LEDQETLEAGKRATEQLRGEGSQVRYLGSTTVTRDESRFCTFEGASETEITEANRRADLSFDREGLARRPARAEPLTRPGLEACPAPAGALAAEQPVARVGHDDVAAAAVQQVAPRPAVEPVPAGARVELVVARAAQEPVALRRGGRAGVAAGGPPRAATLAEQGVVASESEQVVAAAAPAQGVSPAVPCSTSARAVADGRGPQSGSTSALRGFLLVTAFDPSRRRSC
jgi:hypothetical protein